MLNQELISIDDTDYDPHKEEKDLMEDERALIRLIVLGLGMIPFGLIMMIYIAGDIMF